MIGDQYKIKYSDYVLHPDGLTDNGRFILIDATDRVNRPGINTTNFNQTKLAPDGATQLPVNQPIDMTFYGYRAAGYGAQLWNNMFYLLENYAQPAVTRTIRDSTTLYPLYSQYSTTGQIWVDNSHTPPLARWYGLDQKYRKLGAAINITADVTQVTPEEIWFDPSLYTLNYHPPGIGWTDFNCIPYASQQEYNSLVQDINKVTATNLPTLTGTTRPTATHWTNLVTTLQVLGAAYGVSVQSGEPLNTVVANNFTSDNFNTYGFATLASVYAQLRLSMAQIISAKFYPSVTPLAGFTASPVIGGVPFEVTCTDSSLHTGGYVILNGAPPVADDATYFWEFGDGTTSTAVGTVKHTYTTPGTHVIKLTVTNHSGSNGSVVSTSAQTTIQAFKIPTASFLIDKIFGATAPFVVQFTDTSTDTPTSWLWEFGDGTTSSARNPSYEYKTQGKFNVRMTASNLAGSNTSDVSDIDVVVGETPIASFTSTPSGSATFPATIQFTDTSLHVPTSWLWNFGDGTTSTIQNPSHTYTNQGVYSVSLTASNPILPVGNTATLSSPIIIGQVPVASFAYTPASGTDTTLVVQFTDTSTHTPTSWLWNFGDGTTSNTQNPTHTYATQGTYTVTLTATNPIGSNAYTHSNAVAVGRVPVASFTVDHTNGSVPLTVTATDTSQFSPTSWLWNFGDGTTYSGQTPPAHVYNTNGVYTITLTATNPLGTTTNTVTVTTYQYINVDIASNTTDLNMSSLLRANGWNGTSPVVGTVTVYNGVTVMGSSTGVYAFQTGSGYPTGSTLKLVNAGGYILGKGGDGGSNRGGFGASGPPGSNGGPAILASYPITIANGGYISGGGGGGGACGSPSTQASYFVYSGGGGGGAPYGAGGYDSGDYVNAAPGGLTTGGTGGTGYAGRVGGNGGDMGANGGDGMQGENNGGSGGTGGIAGYFIVGNSNVSWAPSGDVRGRLA